MRRLEYQKNRRRILENRQRRSDFIEMLPKSDSDSVPCQPVFHVVTMSPQHPPPDAILRITAIPGLMLSIGSFESGSSYQLRIPVRCRPRVLTMWPCEPQDDSQRVTALPLRMRCEGLSGGWRRSAHDAPVVVSGFLMKQIRILRVRAS